SPARDHARAAHSSRGAGDGPRRDGPRGRLSVPGEALGRGRAPGSDSRRRGSSFSRAGELATPRPGQGRDSPGHRQRLSRAAHDPGRDRLHPPGRHRGTVRRRARRLTFSRPPMEPTLPVLVVGPDTPSPALLDALRNGGLDPRPCGPDDVLGLLSASVARAVVAQPVPFWRLLLSRVVTAGGTAVLHVPTGDLPRALPSGVIAVQRLEDIPLAIRDARSGRGEEDVQPQVALTLEQRLAEAERFSA